MFGFTIIRSKALRNLQAKIKEQQTTINLLEQKIEKVARRRDAKGRFLPKTKN